MSNPLPDLVSKSVSFCKYFFINDKYYTKKRRIKKIKTQIVMRYITEKILISDNYLITGTQARFIAERYFRNLPDKFVLRNAAAIIRELR